jgi:CelD/BcsL family acetyltransferase involved in cellulose biosynthesis
MREQIKDLCRRGLDVYDLGVGENRNKSEWSDTDVALIDTYLGFGPSGRLLALPQAGWAAFKRAVKSRPRLWAMARVVRRVLRGRAKAVTR